jgi:hypothetical protein
LDQFVTGLQAGGFRRGGVCIPSTTRPQTLPFRAGWRVFRPEGRGFNRVGIRINQASGLNLARITRDNIVHSPRGLFRSCMQQRFSGLQPGQFDQGTNDS